MIARVFPRKTVASPDDDKAFFYVPTKTDIERLEGITEVHVSVAFTYDMAMAEFLARQWEALGVPVKMGGPAFKLPGGDFVPGRYLKNGYVITSRGCNKRCEVNGIKYCSVPEREGYQIRELPITDGWNVLDDNLLACSENHIREVFKMLSRQPEKPTFTGGLEPKNLRPWHCDLIREVKTKRLYMAYDTPNDLEPLIEAGKMLRNHGITAESHKCGCYCLIGYAGDTFDKADRRLNEIIAAGFVPYAMLYRDEKGVTDESWRSFQREWCRPQIVTTKMKGAIQ